MTRAAANAVLDFDYLWQLLGDRPRPDMVLGDSFRHRCEGCNAFPAVAKASKKDGIEFLPEHYPIEVHTQAEIAAHKELSETELSYLMLAMAAFGVG